MSVKPDINVGNIIAVCVFVAGIGGTWATQLSQTAQLAERIDNTTAQVTQFQQTMKDRGVVADQDRVNKDTRIRSLEIDAAGKDSDLRNIQITMTAVLSTTKDLQGDINDIKQGMAVLTGRQAQK